MNDNSMTLMLDLFTLACGGYCMYNWLRLLVTKRLFKSGLLIPKEKNVEDCVDEEGFIRRIMPCLSVLAIATTLYGAVYLYNDLAPAPLIPFPWAFIPLGVVMAVLVWYAVVSAKANKEFF